MIVFYPGPRPNTHCTEVNECMSLASIPEVMIMNVFKIQMYLCNATLKGPMTGNVLY